MIGVILMVAITFAIAATVYVYVSGMLGGGLTASATTIFLVFYICNQIIIKYDRVRGKVNETSGDYLYEI